MNGMTNINISSKLARARHAIQTSIYVFITNFPAVKDVFQVYLQVKQLSSIIASYDQGF